MSLYAAFVKAQEIGFSYYNDSTWSHLVWTPLVQKEQDDLLGENVWANGVGRNRKNVDWFLQFEFEQGLTPRRLEVDEIFPKETLGT